VNGPELLAYLERRLRLEGVSLAATEMASLYDTLTDARDQLREIFSLRAPILVRELVTLGLAPGETRVYQLPAASSDPLRCFGLRWSEDREPLSPSAETLLDFDHGEYEWLNPRQVRLADWVSPRGNLEGLFAFPKGPITDGSQESDIGLLVPAHRAIGKLAAYLYLTADEEHDAANAEKIYQTELAQLLKLYGSYDRQAGEALRHAILWSYGTWQWDALY
jgi:hypothetical protein